MAEIAAGRSYPVGATASGAGVNSCVYSKYATRVELLLFERRFVKGDAGVASHLADRVAGSSHLFEQRDREPGAERQLLAR